MKWLGKNSPGSVGRQTCSHYTMDLLMHGVRVSTTDRIIFRIWIVTTDPPPYRQTVSSSGIYSRVRDGGF